MKNGKALVEVEAVSKYYGVDKQKVAALADIKLEVYPGDFMTLSGPSGSGKTTLLNLIGALDRQDEGDIRILGRSLSRLNFDEMTEIRRHSIGFIFQSYNLIPVMTVLENAAFVLRLQNVPAEAAHKQALEALAAVGLQGMEKRFPNQLSGGQQQRVAVARAIAARPALLLADEPTANLDSKNAEELLETMEHLNREHGVTFVFSTHDPRVMQRAQRIIHMKDGRILEQTQRQVG